MKNKKFDHIHVLRLAIPMILTGISTPLLGLVDTAVLGHLDSDQFLGAVAIGALIFSFIFWGFGFLRMGTTGLTAQATGQNNKEEVNAILVRAMLLVLVISTVILLLQKPIGLLSFSLLKSSSAVEQLALHYFEIRIWSTPATLLLYALMGWFLGQQNVRIPFLLVLVINSTNICLDYILVYQLHLHVKGVALATVIAEYTGLFLGLLLAFKVMHKQKTLWNWRLIFAYSQLKAFLLINSHIFIRTWCLIFAFAFFTAKGAKLGDVVLAANAVLFNFQTFMAYALDGFAHTAEVLVGKAVGAKNKVKFRQAINTTGFWSFLVAFTFVVFYLLLGEKIIHLLTSLSHIQLKANVYLPWLIIMPLLSFLCYLFDGVFIGAMLTREMRNTMILALFGVFLPVWYFTQHLGNHGLWFAMAAFMLARSLFMSMVFKLKMKAII